MFLTRYIKESSSGTYVAEVYEEGEGYRVDYFYPNGYKIKTESYQNCDISNISSVIENWFTGIEVLRG